MNFQNRTGNFGNSNFHNNESFNMINEEYFKEMEKNSKLFEEKMKKLNKFKYSNERNNNNNNERKFIQNENEMNNNNQINNYLTFKNNNNNIINNINNNSNDFNNDNNNNNNNINIIIEKLQNEISYKDSLINELREELAQNKDEIEFNNVNKKTDEMEKEIQNLKQNLDIKYSENNELKEENMNLNMKVDNLKIEIQKLKGVKEKELNKSENLSVALAESKEENLNLRNRIKELEKNKNQLEKDYNSLNKNYLKTKKENDKINSLFEEQKAKVFFLTKEIMELKNSKKINYNNINQQKIIDNYYLNNEHKNIYEDEMNINNNNYNNKNNNKKSKNHQRFYSLDKQFYNNSNFPITSLRSSYERKNVNKNNKKQNQNSRYESVNHFPSNIRYNDYDNENENDNLDKQLSYLLIQKQILENSLFKLPTHLRSLNDIKTKKETTLKINKIEEQINQIRTRIRQLNY